MGKNAKTECNVTEQLRACVRDMPSSELQVGRASPLTSRSQSRFHAACLPFPLRIFEDKRDRSRSNKAKVYLRVKTAGGARWGEGGGAVG